MPSANLQAEKLAEKPNDLDYVNQPMKPAMTIVEHKIRNLEKRKAKLDYYKAKQDSGEVLNADQLVAAAKYDEVVQQLELSKDLMKQITQANDDTRKEIKKHRKAELAERAVQETEKLRMLFLFHLVVKDLENCDLSNETDDTADLNNAVLVIKKHEFVRYSELLKLHDPNFQATVEMLATNWSQVLDGSKKSVGAQSGKDRTTFKNIRDNLLTVANSEFFANRQRKEPVVEEEEQLQQDVIGEAPISESESIPSLAQNIENSASTPQQEETPRVEQVIPTPPVAQQQPLTVCQMMDSTYSFLQESQIDLESPHFDPAVVAVSSCLPGPISAHIDHRQQPIRDGYTTSSASVPPYQQLTLSMSNGMNEGTSEDYCNKPMPLIDDKLKITEWNSSESKLVEGNPSDDNELGGTQQYGMNNNNNNNNNNNRAGRGARGNFRRGSSNGFIPRGSSRGRGGFSGNRIGYFRSDQQHQDYGFENPRDFRIGGGYGNTDRSNSAERNGIGYGISGNGFVNSGGERVGNVYDRSGNGFNNSDPFYNNGRGGYRGRNVSSQGNNGNGNNYGGGGGGYRGAVRGNKASSPRSSENGLMAKCY
ncbi:caprin homolog isoform X2 [Folsomia candida]|uniref:caprin homolog isoform X2 n=1 Tax=Folsomia candida TaxID=158441 RepID=UPI000B9016AB|nr:caprin homolog isoform X2 [Folsomia candida]